MIKGIYAAVSAMITGVNRQALKSHNIANLDTPGFKQVLTTVQEFQQTAVTPNGVNTISSSRQSIGNLGLGSMTAETRTDFAGGALHITNQPFGFAIQGDGFFRIMTTDGERYTRDGRFIRDANEKLVTVDGNLVLDSAGKPIKIPDGQLEVDLNGGFLINGELTTQLGVAEFANPENQLQKSSGNLFEALEAPISTISKSIIHHGYLEMSNVNMVDMMISAKTYEAAQKIVQIQDGLLGKSINTLGKLA